MKEYQFTNDWFGVARNMWPSLISKLPDDKSFLEIGSWEGRATVWIAENMAAEQDAMITCVDTWQGGEEHDPGEMNDVFARFSANMSALSDNQKERGRNILIRAIRTKSSQGRGVMVFEDYMWCGSPLLLHRPKPAIDAFTSVFGQDIYVLHNGYQVAIQRMR